MRAIAVHIDMTLPAQSSGYIPGFAAVAMGSGWRASTALKDGIRQAYPSNLSESK